MEQEPPKASAGGAVIDPRKLASNLKPLEEGLWAAVAKTRVSYPEEGSSRCLAVEGGSFWFRHRNLCIVAVARRFPPDGVLWDIGGGNGFVSCGLQAEGLQVALLEPYLEAARSARARGVSTVVCSTLEDAGFHEHSLDAAGLFDVLEHIENEGAFLDRLRRCLKTRGRLYLTVPAYGWLWSSNDRFAGHFRRYTARRLESLLQAHGFRIRYATYFFQPLVFPIFLFRSLPTRVRLRREWSFSSVRREHAPRPGLAASALGWMLRREEEVIRHGGRQSFGASLLAVAETIEPGMVEVA
jgi:2-polyprenyl-3-methyl-5-hydroxy-6-metoxy-1,4-benzoquinol methylase